MSNPADTPPVPSAGKPRGRPAPGSGRPGPVQPDGKRKTKGTGRTRESTAKGTPRPQPGRPATAASSRRTTPPGPKPGDTASLPRAVSSRRGAASPSGAQRPRRPSSSVVLDRKKLGLSAQRPSERIPGLEKAARKSGRISRTEQRRRATGEINRNIAVHVDDTGERWVRKVRLFLLAAAAVLVVSFSVLYLWSRHRHSRVDPEEALRETGARLLRLREAINRIRPFSATDKPSPKEVEKRLRKYLSNRLGVLERRRELELKAKGPGASPLLAEIVRLREDVKLKDGWGKPLEFEVRKNLDRPSAVVISFRSAMRFDGREEAKPIVASLPWLRKPKRTKSSVKPGAARPKKAFSSYSNKTAK